ncbi:hypothetical protein ACFWPY_09530, partial [Streptomyces sp. NPDC058527]|uniref:hypothetical protein n=1 Tax=Streptomyces sp. NPDC058527 TaxID=3346539 RepID=UPI00364D67BD
MPDQAAPHRAECLDGTAPPTDTTALPRASEPGTDRGTARGAESPRAGGGGPGPAARPLARIAEELGVPEGTVKSRL